MTRRKDPSVLQHPHWDKTPIVAIRPDGTVAARFDNPQEAILKAGVNSGNLYQCLKGNKMVANGFRWMKEEEYKEIWYNKGPESLKWERSTMVHSGKKRGFKPGHPPINTWKNGKDNTQRKAASSRSIRKAHERLRQLIAEGAFHPHRKKVRCICTGQVYDSMSQAAKEAGITLSAMSLAIKNCTRANGKYYEIIA